MDNKIGQEAVIDVVNCWGYIVEYHTCERLYCETTQARFCRDCSANIFFGLDRIPTTDTAYKGILNFTLPPSSFPLCRGMPFTFFLFHLPFISYQFAGKGEYDSFSLFSGYNM